MSEDFSNLLSPVQVGAKKIRNRVLISAHVPGIEKDGLVSDAYIAYQRARAKGGAGLQVSGSAAVHATGSVGAGRSLNNTKPEIVEGYQRLADAMHAEGGLRWWEAIITPLTSKYADQLLIVGKAAQNFVGSLKIFFTNHFRADFVVSFS